MHEALAWLSSDKARVSLGLCVIRRGLVVCGHRTSRMPLSSSWVRVPLWGWSGLNLSREVGRYNGALPASVRNARFQQVIISSTRKLELTDIDGCWLTDGMVFFSGLASTTIGRTGRVRFTCIIHGRGLTALASS